MKPTYVLLAVVLFVCMAHAQNRDSIFVQTYPDSVCIWNIDIPATCGTTYMNSISITSDSIVIIENDTSSVHYRCLCNFDVSATLFGLAAGTYHVFIFRCGWGVLDTVFIGSVNFTIGQASSLPFSINSYSSGCHALPVYIDDGKGIPKTFSLLGNYPNPFNPTTIIRFQIYQKSKIRLEVFDQLGQAVVTLLDEERPAGDYEIPWNASKYSSGIYLCKLIVGNETQTLKMIFAK